MKTKICAKCQLRLAVEQYRLRGDKKGLNSYCKKCQKKFDSDYWQRTKENRRVKRRINDKNVRIRNIKAVHNYLQDHHCVDCGESDPVVLEFDHRRDKIYSISDLVRRRASIEKLFGEIKKCQVRCANCHRRKTAKQLNWYADMDI